MTSPPRPVVPAAGRTAAGEFGFGGGLFVGNEVGGPADHEFATAGETRQRREVRLEPLPTGAQDFVNAVLSHVGLTVPWYTRREESG